MLMSEILCNKLNNTILRVEKKLEILREKKSSDTVLDISWKVIHPQTHHQNSPQKRETNREMENQHIRINKVPETDSKIQRQNSPQKGETNRGMESRHRLINKVPVTDSKFHHQNAPQKGGNKSRNGKST